MADAPDTSELKAALLRFETLIDASPKADAVPRWIEDVKVDFERVESLILARRRRIHDKLFGEIADLDPSRRKQIRRLKDVDHDIAKQLDVVKSQILVLELPRSEPDEDNVEPQVQDLLDRATALVSSTRQQEETVAEWFADSFANGT